LCPWRGGKAKEKGLLLPLAFDDLYKQAILTALLFTHFIELQLDSGDLRFDGLDGVPFLREVAR
jgi:hypothetical protein